MPSKMKIILYGDKALGRTVSEDFVRRHDEWFYVKRWLCETLSGRGQGSMYWGWRRWYDA